MTSSRESESVRTGTRATTTCPMDPSFNLALRSTVHQRFSSTPPSSAWSGPASTRWLSTRSRTAISTSARLSITPSLLPVEQPCSLGSTRDCTSPSRSWCLEMQSSPWRRLATGSGLAGWAVRRSHRLRHSRCGSAKRSSRRRALAYCSSADCEVSNSLAKSELGKKGLESEKKCANESWLSIEFKICYNKTAASSFKICATPSRLHLYSFLRI